MKKSILTLKELVPSLLHPSRAFEFDLVNDPWNTVLYEKNENGIESLFVPEDLPKDETSFENGLRLTYFPRKQIVMLAYKGELDGTLGDLSDVIALFDPQALSDMFAVTELDWKHRYQLSDIEQRTKRKQHATIQLGRPENLKVIPTLAALYCIEISTQRDGSRSKSELYVPLIDYLIEENIKIPNAAGLEIQVQQVLKELPGITINPERRFGEPLINTRQQLSHQQLQTLQVAGYKNYKVGDTNGPFRRNQCTYTKESDSFLIDDLPCFDASFQLALARGGKCHLIATDWYSATDHIRADEIMIALQNKVQHLTSSATSADYEAHWDVRTQHEVNEMMSIVGKVNRKYTQTNN